MDEHIQHQHKNEAIIVAIDPANYLLGCLRIRGLLGLWIVHDKSVKSAALGYGVMVFKMRVPAQE